MRENVDVFDFELTSDEMARIAAMDTGTTRASPSAIATNRDDCPANPV